MYINYSVSLNIAEFAGVLAIPIGCLQEFLLVLGHPEASWFWFFLVLLLPVFCNVFQDTGSMWHSGVGKSLPKLILNHQGFSFLEICHPLAHVAQGYTEDPSCILTCMVWYWWSVLLFFKRNKINKRKMTLWRLQLYLVNMILLSFCLHGQRRLCYDLTESVGS